MSFSPTDTAAISRILSEGASFGVEPPANIKALEGMERVNLQTINYNKNVFLWAKEQMSENKVASMKFTDTNG